MDSIDLRSIESEIRAFVKFINCSQRLVEVHWVNYQGHNVHYTNLKPGEATLINTFKTHPWIFLDPKTGERLQVAHKDVFQPEAWFKFINRVDTGAVSVNRQEAKIHIPLKSLHDLCLWRILFLVDSKDDIYTLEIPKTLRTELFRVFNQSTRYTEDDEENQELFGFDFDE